MKSRNITIVRLGSVLLASVCAALPARADYQSTVISQSPVAYYKLNETVSPLFFQVTNSGSLASVAGFYTNNPTLDLAGPFSGSVSVGFDGASQFVETPWVDGLNTSNFTFEVWANPSVSPKFAYLASSVVAAAPRSGWYLAQDDGSTFGFGSAWVCRFFFTNGVTPSVTLHAANPVAGVWTHLVITYDGTTAKLYTNGVVADTEVPTLNSGGMGYVPNQSAPFTVGIRSDLGFYWPGQAAEAAMYSGALSAGRVAAHYSAATTAPASYPSTVIADAPLLYYQFHAPSPAYPTAANLGTLGSAGNGYYVADAAAGAPGPVPPRFPGFPTTNKAAAFDAGGGSVSVPTFNFNTNTLTISGWVNASNLQNIAAGIVVCDTTTSGTGNTYAGLTIDGLNGGLGLGYVWNNDPNTYNWSPSDDAGLATLPDSDWAYVALVIQPSEADIYIAVTNDAASFQSVTNYFDHVNQVFDGPTLIGTDAGQPPYSFNGAIDQVAIWNRSLSIGELYSQYASAVGSLAPQVFLSPQPPASPLYVGDTLDLTVNAGGTPLLSYQWFNNTGPLNGATNTFYEKTNITLIDSDHYYCVVTNLYGTATSGVAAITVGIPTAPNVLTPPYGHILYPGGTLNLSVSAIGGGLKYQWLKGVSIIPGATSASYQVGRVTTNDTGSYSVTITNIIGVTNAGPAVINVFAPSNSYEAAIVADAPEAWFRLNEKSGTNMYDSMGRHDGTYTNISGNPVTFGAPGPIVGSSDTGVTFDGTSQSYGMAPYSPLLNGQTFTIECWAQTSDTSDILSPVSSQSTSLQGYGIWTEPTGSWSGEVDSGGNEYYVPSATASDGVVAGQYTHIVLVYGTDLEVYVNGQWDGNTYVNFDRNASGPLIVGAFGDSPVSDLFNGQVAEVLVYTNALTLAQAQNHYSLALYPNPIPPFFLVTPTSDQVVSNAANTETLTGIAGGPVPIVYQWYKNGAAISGQTNTTLTLSCVNSNAGSYVLKASNNSFSTNSAAATFAVLPPRPASVNVTNALVLHLKFDGNYLDSSGRGNNGSNTGVNSAGTTFVAGRLGSGAVHYVTDTASGLPSNLGATTVTDSSYVTLGNPADLQFGSTTDFSVSYWVQLPAGYENGDLPFFCSSDNSTFGIGITYAPGYTNGGFGFSYNDVGEEGPPNSINDGNWHHLLHTVSRSGSALTYLDGALVDSRLATGIGDLNTAGPINIGQDPTGLYPEQGSAAVDDLAVWRRSLTAYEAYAIYYAATNSNASFDNPAPVKLNVSAVGKNLTLSWKPGATLGTLMQATNIAGPWTPVGVYVPTYQVPETGPSTFYRLNLSE